MFSPIHLFKSKASDIQGISAQWTGDIMERHKWTYSKGGSVPLSVTVTVTENQSAQAEPLHTSENPCLLYNQSIYLSCQ